MLLPLVLVTILGHGPLLPIEAIHRKAAVSLLPLALKALKEVILLLPQDSSLHETEPSRGRHRKTKLFTEESGNSINGVAREIKE